MSVLYVNDTPARSDDHAHHYPKGQQPVAGTVSFVSDCGAAYRVSFDSWTGVPSIQYLGPDRP
jgi:hypothetical protein